MMTDNEHEKSSWVGQALTETETPGNVADKEPVIDQQMKRKIIKMGYWWLTYTAVVTIIILMTPERWMQWPAIKTIVDAVVSKMPYVTFLSTIAESPEVVKYGYCVAWLSSLGHAAFSIAMAIMNYMAGYNLQGKIRKLLAFGWIFPLISWTAFFTCMYCRLPPYRHAVINASGRLAIAFVGQGGVILLCHSIAIYLFAIITLVNRQSTSSKPHSE